MGSLSYCYKEFMKEYVRINITFTKYEKTYNNDYLQSLSEEELEELVKRFNKSHKSYALYTAGIAVANCISNWRNLTDTTNASIGAIPAFMELIGVYEPNDIDFEEI